MHRIINSNTEFIVFTIFKLFKLTLLEALSRYFPVKIRPVSVTTPTPVISIPIPISTCGCVNDEAVLFVLLLPLPGLDDDDEDDDVPLLVDRCDDDIIVQYVRGVKACDRGIKKQQRRLNTSYLYRLKQKSML